MPLRVGCLTLSGASSAFRAASEHKNDIHVNDLVEAGQDETPEVLASMQISDVVGGSARVPKTIEPYLPGRE